MARSTRYFQTVYVRLSTFSRSWLNKLVQDRQVTEGAKLTVIAAILNSNSEEKVSITYGKLSSIRNVSAQDVSKHIRELKDLGWLFGKSGADRMECVISEPEKTPERPKRKFTFETPTYESNPVRKWTAKMFVHFFIDLMEEQGTIMNLPRALMARKLMQDGVQKLRRYDRSNVNPNIRYRKYLIWAVQNKPFLGDRILRDKMAMEAFVADNAPEFENSDQPQTLEDQLAALAD